MISPQYCQTFAAYNAWMNEKLYAAAEQLSDLERKRDRAAFFRSIHSTLNHILWGDRVWLGRFNGQSYHTGKMGQDLFDDYAQLKTARLQMDADLTQWAAGVQAEQLAGDLTWFSGVAQRDLTRPRWLCVVQMFNHQTHHRGQATTLLKQTGIDPGITDLPWAPLQRNASGQIVLGDEYGL